MNREARRAGKEMRGPAPPAELTARAGRAELAAGRATRFEPPASIPPRWRRGSIRSNLVL